MAAQFLQNRKFTNQHRVTLVSENAKFPSDSLSGRMSLTSEPSASADTNLLSEAEAQMRRALGLYGEGTRQRQDSDRPDQSNRPMDRFGQGGHTASHQGLHRRRFVQDGEVPVTVVRRDADSVAAAGPQSSRLQRTEAALAAETVARDRADRALLDAQTQIRDLQTKIGHAELARAEAVEAARRDREAAASLAGSSTASEEQVQALQEQVDSAEQSKRTAQAALAEERTARKTAERALREATERAAQAEATLLLREQEQAAEALEAERRATAARRRTREQAQLVIPLERETASTRKFMAAKSPAIWQPDVKVAAKRGRPLGSKSTAKPVAQPAQEAEPVKWWLTPTTKAKGR